MTNSLLRRLDLAHWNRVRTAVAAHRLGPFALAASGVLGAGQGKELAQVSASASRPSAASCCCWA